jgi:hypothetical protein
MFKYTSLLTKSGKFKNFSSYDVHTTTGDGQGSANPGRQASNSYNF